MGDLFVNVGYGNMVKVADIYALAIPTSNPVKRDVAVAKESGNFRNFTHGRRICTLIFLTNGTVIASALRPDTITRRIADLIVFPQDRAALQQKHEYIR